MNLKDLFDPECESCVIIMCPNDEFSWMMSSVGCLLKDSVLPDKKKVKRMGKTEILRRIWLFSANKIKKTSESGSKQPIQLIIAANNCHIIF